MKKTIFKIMMGTLFLVICFLSYAEANSWKFTKLVDEFGDKTGEVCIFATDKNGYFSNSATNKSICFGEILITKDKKVGIFLYEYGKPRPTYLIGGGELLMKNNKGEKRSIKISDWKWGSGGNIILASNAVISFFKESAGIIKIVVYDNYSSEYHFEINANGFTKVYNKMYQ